MPLFKFADGAAVFDTTPIENLFLIDYLPNAPEGFLRVYLYARMLSLHPELGGEFADMAATLRQSEEELLEAFAYWEQQGLVRRLTDRPPTFEMLPVRAGDIVAAVPMERDYYVNRDFNAQLQALFPGKIVHPQEYVQADEWQNLFGFEPDAVLEAVKWEIENGRSKDPEPSAIFRRLKKRMLEWSDRGVRSAADMQRELRFAGSVRELAAAVLKRMGSRRRPTDDELACANRWLGEWKLSAEQVLEACGEFTKARQPSFAYLNAVLEARVSGEGARRQALVDVLKELSPGEAQPTPEDMKAYAALREAGFEAETIKLAAVVCHRKRKNRLQDVVDLLDSWGGQGLYRFADAEAFVRENQEKRPRLRKLLAQAGLDRRPSMDDLSRYEAWSSHFSDEMILYAAECARGMQLPMLYMDKLLGNWQAKGIDSVEAARASVQSARASRAGASNGGAAPANPALDYAQREYRDEDFGDDFFINLSEPAEGGDPK